jgi:uncharacterized protein
MTVVSNTSPIIALDAITSLDILRKLYGKIYIPSAVLKEITVQNCNNDIKSLQWIQTNDVINKQFVYFLEEQLDEGEAEAISLAIQLNADLLIIDEKKGRKIASRLNIKYSGILGELVIAKKLNIISSVKLLTDDLVSKVGFRVSQDLYNEILSRSGEL